MVSDVRSIGAGRADVAARARRTGHRQRRRPCDRDGARSAAADPAESVGAQQRRRRAVQPRHRRTAPALPSADRAQRGEVVPAVQRTRRGIRPRVACDQGGARRRRLGGLRPEGLDHMGRRGGLRDPAGPHRSRPAQAYRASRTSCSTCTSPASRCARCDRSPGKPSSTRCSSTARGSPTRTGSARSTTAGGSARRRCPVSGRWCRDRAPGEWADSVAPAPSA